MHSWFAISGCLLVSFFFSGIEAGLLSLNRIRHRHRLKLKDPAALRLNGLLADPERSLVSVLIVTNLLNICALSLGLKMAVDQFGTAGYGLTLAVALPVWLLGLEMLPKSLFRRFPYSALATLSGPLRLADLLLSPLHALGSRLTRPVFLRRPAQRLKLFAGREDFKYLTFQSEKEGAISAGERHIIHAVVDFRALTAGQALVPLEKTGMVSASASLAEARQIARAHQVDRLPVQAENGEICGILDLHELAIRGQWHGKVEFFQRRILKARLHESAYSLLRKLRAARLPMAVVVGMRGETAGILVWDDLVRLLLEPEPAGSATNSRKRREFDPSPAAG
jgi:CBS domain containing-hemolysin-like protein